MRRRILALVVGMTVLVVLAFAIPLTLLIRSTTSSHNEDATVAQAGRIAFFLRSFPAPSTSEIRTDVAREVGAAGRPVSVTLPDGTTIGSTPADDVGTPGGGDRGPNGPGFGDRPQGPPAQLQGASGGQVAVAVAFSSEGSTVVRVYLSDAARYNGSGRDYVWLAGTAVLLVLVGVGAGEVLTRRIVRPLVQTAATAQQLSTGDTLARAPTTGPAEVAGVGLALNRLADRIDELIAEERETVADLSHRLRTPLTALRLDAEALRDPAEADRVGEHVTTLERMLTAIIRAARRPEREGRMPSSDAAAVVADRVAFWSALTEEQQRAAHVELAAGPLPVRAAAEDLAAAVDALLENVVAHTPEGTAFAVRLRRLDGGGAELEVADDGPGLPATEPVRGRSDRGSSGLGLDIARRSAQAAGGTLTLGASESGGACVIMRLGGSHAELRMS